jgi:hypothetical protein
MPAIILPPVTIIATSQSLSPWTSSNSRNQVVQHSWLSLQQQRYCHAQHSWPEHLFSFAVHVVEWSAVVCDPPYWQTCCPKQVFLHEQLQPIWQYILLWIPECHLWGMYTGRSVWQCCLTNYNGGYHKVVSFEHLPLPLPTWKLSKRNQGCSDQLFFNPTVCPSTPSLI